MTTTQREFTLSGARSVLVEALDTAGLEAHDIEPLHLGENAVFWLWSRSVVARVGRRQTNTVAADNRIRLARWLANQPVAVTRLADVAQPIWVRGQAVTLWEPVDDQIVHGSTTELATLLRQLHALKPPSDITLSAVDPFVRTRISLDRVTTLTDDDRRFLTGTLDDLADLYNELFFTSDPVLLHGDANVYNVLRSSDGEAVLGDFDTIAIGPRELDLVPTAVYYQRLGWLTEKEYADFVDTYGLDVTEWFGYPLIARAVELELIAWLAQSAGTSQWVDEELIKRIRTLREDTSRNTWEPFLGQRLQEQT